MAERDQLIEAVAVGVPLPVKVRQREPLAVVPLADVGDAHRTADRVLQLPVREPPAFAAADVVDPLPERLRRTLRDCGEQSRRIDIRDPLEHTGERRVSHDRVADLEHAGAEDPGLAQPRPARKTRVDE